MRQRGSGKEGPGVDTFAERLRYYRVRSAYSQKGLAQKLGMTRQNYSRYENKALNVQPTLELLQKMAAVLGIDVNTLIGYQANEKEKMLAVLRSAGIKYKIDTENTEALNVIDLITNNVDIDQIEIAITFDELKKLIADTERDWLEASSIFFRQFFFCRLCGNLDFWSNVPGIPEKYKFKIKRIPIQSILPDGSGRGIIDRR